MPRLKLVCSLTCILGSSAAAFGQPGENPPTQFGSLGSFRLSAAGGPASNTNLLESFLRAPVEESSAEKHTRNSTAPPDPFVFSLAEHWLAPWPHSHFSREGTPFVHLFLTEPAFLDRDVFLDYRFINGNDENEVELELEIEWALTRRIGVVLELPYLFIRPQGHENDDPDREGFGDFAIAPRFLLMDTERFLLSANLEIEIPTGSRDEKISADRVKLAPSVSWWCDLGHWFSWQGQTGVEVGIDSADSELFWNTAVTYSFLGPALYDAPSHDHGQVRHYPPGQTNLMAELTGRTLLSGDENGRTTAELLVGGSYLLTSNWEVRAGFQFPIFEPRDLNNSVVFGLIYHF